MHKAACQPCAHNKVVRRAFGAGEGNRTLVSCLGSNSSTIELHPRCCNYVNFTVASTGAVISKLRKTNLSPLKSISTFLVAAFLSACAFAADVPVYDESADAQAQVAQALAIAKADNKQLMIVFGANWCGDCKMLDSEFKKPAMKALLDANYVVVKVDVKRFNKNLDVVKPYGDVIKKGIPSIVITTSSNLFVYATNGGELADARKMGETGVAEFFRDLVARKGRG